MFLRIKTKICDRILIIGMLAALLGIVHAPVVRAQSNDEINSVFQSLLVSFNDISAQFAEAGFGFDSLEDETIQGWRSGICSQLGKIVGSEDLVTSAFDEIEKEIAGTKDNFPALDQLREMARSGDTFTEFLRNEKELLQEFGLSQASWEIALQQAIRLRPFFARASSTEYT